jgi:hypothetical protein
MQIFIVVLRVVASIIVLAGLSHVIWGPGSDVLLGAELSSAALSDPVLDSQNRFYGTTFIGYGVLLFLCATDVKKYATVLNIVAGFIFLGGVVRLISVAQVGLPPPLVIGLIVSELIAAPVILWWHAQVLRGS